MYAQSQQFFAQMIRSLSVVCLFYSTAYAQVSKTDSLRFSQELIRIEQGLLDAVTAGDPTTWKRNTADDFFIATEDGSRLNRTEFLSGIMPLPSGYSGSIKLTEPKIVFHGATAMLNYTADETEYIYGQKIHTTYNTMNAYYNAKGQWKLVASQVFEVPQFPPAITVSATVLDQYVGIYALTDTISCEVSVSNDSLFIRKKGSKEYLSPETENVFFRKSDTRGRKIFMIDTDRSMMMLERRNGQDLIWKRKK